VYPTIRPILFRLDPERAHGLTIQLLRLSGSLPPVRGLLRAWFRPPQKPVTGFGLNFINPVGLAAGYDKDGLAWRGLACLGFGHIEVGTVTLRPQPGNPRPRLFRLVPEQALINRLGFPGKGAAFVARQIVTKRPPGLVLGVNLGKNKETPLESAFEDYLELMKIFAPLADYLAVNVSSPNTVGLRRLQARDALEGLLLKLKIEQRAQASRLGKEIPLLVKLAPDLGEAELDDALEAIMRTGMQGVMATNTTISREGLIRRGKTELFYETGGLSGKPLRERSTAMVRQIYQRTGGRLPIVGIGGVMDADSAREKLDAGAVLVQLYTGLVFNGPGLASRIVRGLAMG
jgi:dihydroorotate dehydrogenase